jgi:hypothetical protein
VCVCVCVCVMMVCLVSVCEKTFWEIRLNLGEHVWIILRVGQNRIYAPCMTVYLVISLPTLPYIHCIYMVLANPTHSSCFFADAPGVSLQKLHLPGVFCICVCLPAVNK